MPAIERPRLARFQDDVGQSGLLQGGKCPAINPQSLIGPRASGKAGPNPLDPQEANPAAAQPCARSPATGPPGEGKLAQNLPLPTSLCRPPGYNSLGTGRRGTAAGPMSCPIARPTVSIYKPCDIRGKVAGELTPELYRRWGTSPGKLRCRPGPSSSSAATSATPRPPSRTPWWTDCAAGKSCIDLGQDAHPDDLSRQGRLQGRRLRDRHRLAQCGRRSTG